MIANPITHTSIVPHSGIVTPSVPWIAFDTFDGYANGQTSSFGNGVGMTNYWRVSISYFTLIAFDTFDEYANGQTSNFTGSAGWSNNWIG